MLAWRIRDGRLEMAPSQALLDRFTSADERLSDLPMPRGVDAWSQLPDAKLAFALISPALLAQRASGLLAQLGERLHPDFRVAMAITHEAPWLVAHSNVGLWTLAAVVASASRDEIDELTLPGLSPRCRQAHDAMCSVFPQARRLQALLPRAPRADRGGLPGPVRGGGAPSHGLAVSAA